ncbi:MAG: tetratricopeptide repeat protein [Candidatus Sericytochromatia bacterium]
MKPLSALISDPAQRNLLATLRQACEAGLWLQAELQLNQLRHLAPGQAVVPLGEAWLAVGRRQLAVAEGLLQQALAQEPNWGDVWLLLARVCQQQGHYLPALHAVGQVLRLDPLHPPALRLLVTLLQNSGDFGGLQSILALLLDPALRAQPAWRGLSPLEQQDLLTWLPELQALQLLYHFGATGDRAWVQGAAAAWEKRWLGGFPAAQSWPQLFDPERPLRVLFVSNEWHTPAVRQGYGALFKGLDPARFVLLAAVDQAWTPGTTLSPAFQEHLACADWDPWRWYREVQSRQVDIVVDLSGWFNPARLSSLALKAAPILIAAGSNPPFEMGLSAYDVLLSDALLTPPDRAPRERLQTLNSFFHWQPPALQPPVAPVRQPGPLRLGSAASLNKLSDASLALWVAVMNALPEARFYHKNEAWSDPELQARFQARWQALGGRPDQLQLENNHQRSGLLEFFAELDLILDTTPYAGALTTCEALWVGTPVLALAGGLRIADSLRAQVQLPELLAATPAEFVAQAVALTQQPERLQRWRQELPQRLLSSSICQAAHQAEEMAAVLQASWQHWGAKRLLLTPGV